MQFIFPLFILLMLFPACKNADPASGTGGKMPVSTYFNDADSGVKSGGVRMIPIETPAGQFKVWTKRFGNNPRIKILLLHGGPAMTHEYMECFESFFPKEGFEIYRIID